MNIPTESVGVAAPINGGWDALAADWRAQPTAVVDVDALRRDVTRHRRRIRAWLALEILLTTVGVGVCAWATLGIDPPLFSPSALAVTIALLLGFQGWSLWIRRRQVRDSGLDVRALLALERDRISTSLLYWRVNSWLAVAMWVALFGLLLAGVLAPDAIALPMTPRQAALSLAINIPLVLGLAGFAWWWCRRSRSRLARVQALQDELDAD
ncbi:hypothetical protein [Novilysobacter erysipheiresistens]|uniref:Uncharacterized protein n=1 Tax=Novilysobacter erysipheiresistens TaxID=1749332 RepID=A0ABU7YZD9_9GAMM